jgi:F0F1-type ATP synthase assembly protein I
MSGASPERSDDPGVDGKVQYETTRIARQVGSGSESMDFISSIISGLLIGLLLDWWLETTPVFVVIGIVLGFVSGFYKLWGVSASLERQAEERRRD